jgi:hypothetical protein
MNGTFFFSLSLCVCVCMRMCCVENILQNVLLRCANACVTSIFFVNFLVNARNCKGIKHNGVNLMDDSLCIDYFEGSM